MQIKNVNILVVDDVILMCNFLYGVASRIPGCRVFKALSGKAAADILEKEAIDLLITDIEIKMPAGLELVYKLRCGLFSNTAHDIPAIIFSGNTYRELIAQSILLDVNDFLAKPITSVELAKKIQHHLSTETAIKVTDYYSGLKMDFSPKKQANSKINVGIVLEPSARDEDENNVQDENDSQPPNKRNFLFMPENTTTGYFQLDRRLRNFAFKVSCFHNVFVGDSKPIAIDTERRLACESADYLFHVAQNIKEKEQRPEFWLHFSQHLEKLKTLTAELSTINIKHHRQVSLLLKKLSYWWMQTCNRPIIQKNDNSETNDPADH